MSNLKQNIDAILSETSNRICKLVLESATKNQYDSIVKELEPVLDTKSDIKLDIKSDINQTAQVSKVILIKKESIEGEIKHYTIIFKKLVEEISQIGSEYIDIVKFTGDKNLMLMCCADKGNLEAVKFLVESGADIHAENDYALRWSAANGHLEVVKFLVESEANIHNYDDRPLVWSAVNGHLEVVKFLVESGADIHAYNDSPLYSSAAKGHLEVVKFLVESGADIHAGDDYALRSSARNGKLEVVKFLVKKYVADNKSIPDVVITRKNNDSNKIMFMYAKPDQYKLFNEELVKMLTPIKSILN